MKPLLISLFLLISSATFADTDSSPKEEPKLSDYLVEDDTVKEAISDELERPFMVLCGLGGWFTGDQASGYFQFTYRVKNNLSLDFLYSRTDFSIEDENQVSKKDNWGGLSISYFPFWSPGNEKGIFMKKRLFGRFGISYHDSPAYSRLLDKNKWIERSHGIDFSIGIRSLMSDDGMLHLEFVPVAFYLPVSEKVTGGSKEKDIDHIRYLNLRFGVAF